MLYLKLGAEKIHSQILLEIVFVKSLFVLVVVFVVRPTFHFAVLNIILVNHYW